MHKSKVFHLHAALSLHLMAISIFLDIQLIRTTFRLWLKFTEVSVILNHSILSHSFEIHRAWLSSIRLLCYTSTVKSHCCEQFLVVAIFIPRRHPAATTHLVLCMVVSQLIIEHGNLHTRTYLRVLSAQNKLSISLQFGNFKHFSHK